MDYKRIIIKNEKNIKTKIIINTITVGQIIKNARNKWKKWKLVIFTNENENYHDINE